MCQPNRFQHVGKPSLGRSHVPVGILLVLHAASCIALNLLIINAMLISRLDSNQTSSWDGILSPPVQVLRSLLLWYEHVLLAGRGTCSSRSADTIKSSDSLTRHVILCPSRPYAVHIPKGCLFMLLYIAVFQCSSMHYKMIIKDEW